MKFLKGLGGASALFIWLASSVLFAAIPMIVGLAVTLFIPEIGDVRSGLSGWAVLHFLWMYPVMYLVITEAQRVGNMLFPDSKLSRDIVETVGMVAALVLMYSIFFESTWGALAACLVALCAYAAFSPVVKKLEHMSDYDDGKTS